MLEFQRGVLAINLSAADPDAICRHLSPGRWMVEAGREPPSPHHPDRLLACDQCHGGLALSVSTDAAMAVSLGPALIDRLAALGTKASPMLGLALQELITNAAIHGNLKIGSGRAADWADLAVRHAAIVAALADPAYAGRCVTIAFGWSDRELTGVVVDEGDGYNPASLPHAGRGAGRGLRIARMVGRVEVDHGGRQTGITVGCVSGPRSDAA